MSSGECKCLDICSVFVTVMREVFVVVGRLFQTRTGTVQCTRYCIVAPLQHVLLLLHAQRLL